MSELTLGPVIGKIGGASEALEFLPDEPVDDYTVNLPDGEWLVIILLETGHYSGYGGLTVSINGEQKAVVHQGGTNRRTSGVSVIARKKTGAVRITTPSLSTGSSIYGVLAFPDPTT